jgi:hypothetical protein
MEAKLASRPPRRQRKEDRLRHPSVTTQSLRCDLALAPVTRAWEAADDEWGFETILGLVPPTWASRYGAVMADLNRAYGAEDVAACDVAAAAVVKAIAGMVKGLRDAGHVPTRPEVWWVEADDGTRLGFVRRPDDQARAMADNPGATICTAREALVALKPALFGLGEVKRHFPGAEMTAMRAPTELEEELDDAIVF